MRFKPDHRAGTDSSASAATSSPKSALRIAIAYPPFRKNGALPLLTQNRQSKFTQSDQVRIYPLVMASAATMLRRDGHDVLWLDGINERLSMADYETRLAAFRPDWIVLETKTPLIRLHWEHIRHLKDRLGCRVLLLGDHLFHRPEESFEHSDPDVLVVAGDYDFVLRDFFAFETGRRPDRPGGLFWKENGGIRNSGRAEFYELGGAPQIDRDLTRWKLYGEAYLLRPVAYILTGRGCGGRNPDQPEPGAGRMEWRETKGTSLPGRCTFCVWQYTFWGVCARLRPVRDVADEIEDLVTRHGVAEVFDDNESGPLWHKPWLREFVAEMERRGLPRRVRFSTNARADNLDEETIALCRRLNVRLLKIGLESGNNETLRRLKKDETIEEISAGVLRAKRAGLVVLLTTMVGYPWETEEGARQTYEATRRLMLTHTHFGDSLQASVVIPYPGTPLYQKAVREGWFIVDPTDYDRFDQSEPVLRTEIDTTAWCRRMWAIMKHPLFLLRSALTLRSRNDLRLAWNGLRSLRGHLHDYGTESGDRPCA
ncbi:MAG: radical SAM protein [Kiritimatiellia bacterium]|nr:radical SAM protein [Kiritimatiellia bacterium]